MNDKDKPNNEPQSSPAVAAATMEVTAPTSAAGPLTPAPPVPEPPARPEIAVVVEHYVASTRGIGQTAQIALPHILKWRADELIAIHKKMAKFGPDESGASYDKTFEFTIDSARDFAEFTESIRKFEELKNLKAFEVLARSLFTQLFAEFDSYIGDLLTTIYLKNEDLLKGISREISLSELMCHPDLKSVKRSMLDKEIETFRRDSYVEQFANLEKKFGLTLRKFKEWAAFVELSQRRNVLIHNGGCVSEQYLSMCEREGYKFTLRPKAGDGLEVTSEYFLGALRLLTKVGLMLGYTLWSKVFPKDLQALHSELNETIYTCLSQKRWLLASELGDFVLSDAMTKEISDVEHRIRIVNVAIGLKFANRNAEAMQLLKTVDWSASYRDFRLALAVLEERYDDALEIMKSIGKRGELLRQHYYHVWPLFTKFRERPEFYAAYLEIYGEAFAEKLDTEVGSIEARAGKSPPSEIFDVKAKEITHTEASPAKPVKRPRKAKPTAKNA